MHPPELHWLAAPARVLNVRTLVWCLQLALYVLSFLTPGDLLQAAQTCCYWRILAEDNLLWREKCHEEGKSSRLCVCLHCGCKFCFFFFNVSHQVMCIHT